MYFQLWSGIPHDRQRGDRRQFARLQVETGTAVNVAEAEFDDVAAEVGSKVREAGDNRLAGSAVNLGQPGRAAFETLVGNGSLDRKRVGGGKSVSVSVDFGGGGTV